ncbi:sprouty-related, EVH1 domain-containing protein 2-like isoform X2 [Nelusetta ayraudi]|uniref:sprouty-related, EVH1 domain-containing protein 2-like isoform X2 n=1 Tax=Nelusetta ayraudi TaxID=303726 RepID=UPI003F708F84
MIEETPPSDDSYMVRVKAVVMTRDDSSGGWLAQDGGALSRVGVCRLQPPQLAPGPPAGLNQFLIRGERLRDKQMILDCPLRKELVYTVATPTFHHWRLEDRKCGLSFQSPADGRAFDRGVRKAMEDLAEGSTTSSSTALQNESELGDDDVFTNATDSSSNSSQKMESSLPPFESSPLPRHKCMLGHRHDLLDPNRLSDHYFLDQLSRPTRHVKFQEDEEIVRINPRERSWERAAERHHHHQQLGRCHQQQQQGRYNQQGRHQHSGYEDYRHAAVRDRFLQTDDSDVESYVHFAKTEAHKHDYTYPLAPLSDPDPALGPLASKGSGGPCRPLDFSSVVSAQPRSSFRSSPAANGGKGRKEGGGVGTERAQCEHCGEAFYLSDNRRGRCQDAPDPVGVCIRRISCMWLADTMLYHCMSDPEGEYSDPCSCEVGGGGGGGDIGGGGGREGGGGGGGGGARLGTRWLALLGLSLVAPCLCLYPPLHACHQGATRCGCCGGRHKALS